MSLGEVVSLWLSWGRLKGAIAKEKSMAEADGTTHYDPFISAWKGIKALAIGFWVVVGPQVLQWASDLLSWGFDYLTNTTATTGALQHGGMSHDTATAVALLLAAAAALGKNWRANRKNGPTLPGAGRAVALGLAFLFLTSGAYAQDIPQIHVDTYTWKSLLRQQGTTDDMWGGRVIAAVSGLPGGVTLGARVDISALRPVDLNAPDISSLKTLEMYVSLHRRVLEGHGLAIAPAVVLGRIATFDGSGQLRADHPRTIAGGLRLSYRGGWLYVLAGQHDVAGAGTHALVAGQLPLWGAFGIAGDYVTGPSGFGRVGATVRLPTP